MGLASYRRNAPSLGSGRPSKYRQAGCSRSALFIVQDDVVGLYRLGCDVPEVLGIVQLIEIAANEAPHLAGSTPQRRPAPGHGSAPRKNFHCVVLRGACRYTSLSRKQCVPDGRDIHKSVLSSALSLAAARPMISLSISKSFAIKGGCSAHELFQRGAEHPHSQTCHGVNTSNSCVFSPLARFLLRSSLAALSCAPGWTAFSVSAPGAGAAWAFGLCLGCLGHVKQRKSVPRLTLR